MSMRRTLLLLACLSNSLAPACSVTVFRYALEGWQSAPYQAIVFFRGKLDAEQQREAKRLQDAPANLIVQLADVDGKLDAPLERLWKKQANPQLPWLLVRYPE